MSALIKTIKDELIVLQDLMNRFESKSSGPNQKVIQRWPANSGYFKSFKEVDHDVKAVDFSWLINQWV